jgi:hypothetical protein
LRLQSDYSDSGRQPEFVEPVERARGRWLQRTEWWLISTTGGRQQRGRNPTLRRKEVEKTTAKADEPLAGTSSWEQALTVLDAKGATCVPRHPEFQASLKPYLSIR